VSVRVLPLNDERRFDAAPGLHELLGGVGVDGLEGDVGAVGPAFGSSPLEQPAARIAISRID
jgi:hypothetical protein